MRRRIPRVPDHPLPFIRYMLRHCSTRVKVQACYGCICEAIATASDMLVSWVLGRIVGVILNSGPHLWQALSHEILLLAGLWIIRNIFYRGREFMDRRYVTEMLNTTRELLFNRLIQQSQVFLHSNFAGVLANHVRRAGDIINSLRDKVQRNIIPLAVRFGTASILLWQITPLFVLFIMLFLLFGIVCAYFTAHYWSALSTREAEASSRLTGYIVDSTTNILLVKQNVGWETEQQRLNSVHQDMQQAYVNRVAYTSKYWGTFDLIMTLFFCGFMVLLAYAWQTGHVTAAQLAMTVGIVTNLFGAIATSVSLMNSTFDEIGILQDSLQKISTPLSVYDAPDAPDLRVTEGKIEFRDVTFCYAQRENLFEHMTLVIPAGQKVGLVGVSGAGKTTLCQLLLRNYDVNGGGIFIDGQNIAEVTQDSLHAAIAVIPQDPTLFHRTLGENIGYGRHAATQA
ncbi:MAG: ABC transporter ATP-binding protein, partial [Proteobacteria bacterium]|nr:ABC transporter ATP-binding protein [Pseudomonadota bacterium]